MCLPLTLNLPTQNATLKLVIKNAPTDEIASINNLTHHTRKENKRYIKNLSSQALTNNEVKLLSRGLVKGF